MKVEVADCSVRNFQGALRFYDAKRNAVEEKHRRDATPVYKFNLVCLDESTAKKSAFSEIWLFSYDGQGGDFVDRVRL